jgi:hypothetical protein
MSATPVYFTRDKHFKNATQPPRVLEFRQDHVMAACERIVDSVKQFAETNKVQVTMNYDYSFHAWNWDQKDLAAKITFYVDSSYLRMLKILLRSAENKKDRALLRDYGTDVYMMSNAELSED